MGRGASIMSEAMNDKSHTAKELMEPPCFERVYNASAPKLLRYALLHLSSREDAEEVLANTFTRFWEYLASHPGITVNNVNAFLFRIAKNLVIDTYRSRKKQISVEMLKEVGIELVDKKQLSSELRIEVSLVLQEIHKLAPETRDLLLLRFVEEIPVKTIAEIYGITETNASVRIHRAVKKLKEQYGRI